MRSLFATTVELPAFLIFSTILPSSSPAISQPLLLTLFRAFIKPPDSEAEKFSHYASLDALPQRVQPNLVDHAGFQVLLPRELICLDTNLQMEPTHIVESIQFRGTLPSDPSIRLARELELNRSLLFAGKQGGLRPVVRGELRDAGYDFLGGLKSIDPASGAVKLLFARSLYEFPANCGICHGGGTQLFAVPHSLSKPMRSESIEAVALEKETNGTLHSLRNLSVVQRRDSSQ